MADGTGIEWTDATWNIVTGCSVLSPGCKNCYAMKLAGTRLKNHPSRAGLTRPSKAGPVWTGEVRFNEEWLDQPLRWSRPRMIFVCAHGDLFHEDVPDEWLDRIFAVMALAPQHVFQVLTKRPERMRAYLSNDLLPIMLAGQIRTRGLDVRPQEIEDRLPLPNVWIGTSVEDQERADQRIPILIDTPAAVRWLSCEPLLGPVDVQPFGLYDGELQWVVAGGESGPGARPMHPDWARSLRDQCDAADVAFLFKQHGDWAAVDGEAVLNRCAPERGGKSLPQMDCVFTDPVHKAGVQQSMWRVGKKEAGRLLDGREWNGYPTVGGNDGPTGARAIS